MLDTDIARWQLLRRLHSLYVKLRHWRRLSRDGQSAFATNHSQIRAFSSAIRAVGLQIKFAARKEKTSLAELRMLTADLLGLFRVWEFLRSKLAQRLDSEITLVLRLADEFAWSCFEPVAKVSYKEPPLVFLNGGYSPYMLPRHQAFQPEYVQGDARDSRVIKTLTSELPFPVIGLPWYQASAVWDLPLIAHEVGHTAEDDLKLKLPAIIGAVIPDESRKSNWVRWSSEVFADYYGAAATGPAFVSALASFLAGTGDAREAPEYPPKFLRFELNLKFIPWTPAEKLRQRWAAAFPVDPQMEEYVRDCKSVAAALGSIDIRLTRMTRDDAADVSTLADYVVAGRQLQRTYNPRIIVAAMREVYDRQVAAGNLDEAVQQTQSLCPVLAATREIGTRDLDPVSKAAKRQAQARRAGAWVRLLHSQPD